MGRVARLREHAQRRRDLAAKTEGREHDLHLQIAAILERDAAETETREAARHAMRRALCAS